MDFNTLRSSYPIFFKKIPEEIFEIRELIAVDHNYEDIIFSEEPADLEPDEYNYMAYFTPELQAILGEGGMQTLAERLAQHKEVDDFLPSEEDLFGIQADLDEEEVTHLLLREIEDMVS